MELKKTPLTYQQASEVLEVSLETIKKAVLRGVLTRLPREGLYQHLMVGQVQLFKGKTLSLSVLNENDRKLWQAYADSVYQRTVLDRSNVQATNSEAASSAGSGVPQESNFTLPQSIRDLIDKVHLVTVRKREYEILPIPA